jgi:hypothetical protein
MFHLEDCVLVLAKKRGAYSAGADVVIDSPADGSNLFAAM